MLAKKFLPVLQRVSATNGGAASQVCRLYSYDHHFKPPHMNELPVPEGSWDEANRKTQRKYNLHLAFGIGFSIFSIAVAKNSGLFFLNLSPPDRID